MQSCHAQLLAARQYLRSGAAGCHLIWLFSIQVEPEALKYSPYYAFNSLPQRSRGIQPNGSKKEAEAERSFWVEWNYTRQKLYWIPVMTLCIITSTIRPQDPFKVCKKKKTHSPLTSPPASAHGAAPPNRLDCPSLKQHLIKWNKISQHTPLTRNNHLKPLSRVGSCRRGSERMQGLSTHRSYNETWLLRDLSVRRPTAHQYHSRLRIATSCTAAGCTHQQDERVRSFTHLGHVHSEAIVL